MTAEKPVSKQLAWQRKMVSAGKCRYCAKPLGRYRSTCDACGEKIAAAQRIRNGYAVKQPGSRGRPSLSDLLPWHSVDWSARDSEIARSLRCTPAAVSYQRKKRACQPPPAA